MSLVAVLEVAESIGASTPSATYCRWDDWSENFEPIVGAADLGEEAESVTDLLWGRLPQCAAGDDCACRTL